MPDFIKSTYLSPLFFISGASLVVLFVLGFFFSPVFSIANVGLYLWILVITTDLFLLYAHKNGMFAERLMLDKLSNGDENKVSIILENNYTFPIKLTIIDELPFQFQKRDFLLITNLKSGQKKILNYVVIPKERGEYEFGNLNVYTQTPLGLLQRRYKFASKQTLPVYPGFLQMRKYELMAISNRLHEMGVKKIRRIGNNREFEQIKEYVKGDDYRTINWRATARRTKLMVNQYQDEKAQQVYAVIDMGRSMKQPFNGMTLLDYAINSALILSNTALLKDDKAGLVTFEKSVKTIVKAKKKRSQIKTILDVLYNQTTRFNESGYEHLFTMIKRYIKHRSLLILFTNFETKDSLTRQLPYLQMLAKHHLLIVVFFKNEELYNYIHTEPYTTLDVYKQTIAEKLILEKNEMIKLLNKNGIKTIFTRPQDLTVNTINKYIEVKARGMF